MNNDANTQYLNYMSIELLEYLGNSKPTQFQIDEIESYILKGTNCTVLERQLNEQEIDQALINVKKQFNRKTAKLLGIKKPTKLKTLSKTLAKISCNNEINDNDNIV